MWTFGCDVNFLLEISFWGLHSIFLSLFADHNSFHNTKHHRQSIIGESEQFCDAHSAEALSQGWSLINVFKKHLANFEKTACGWVYFWALLQAQGTFYQICKRNHHKHQYAPITKAKNHFFCLVSFQRKLYVLHTVRSHPKSTYKFMWISGSEKC